MRPIGDESRNLALRKCELKTRNLPFNEATRGARAAALLAGLDTLEGITVQRFQNGSNIFPITLRPEVGAEVFVTALRRRSVFVYTDDHEPSRISLTVNPTMLRRSTEELVEACEKAMSRDPERRHQRRPPRDRPLRPV